MELSDSIVKLACQRFGDESLGVFYSLELILGLKSYPVEFFRFLGALMLWRGIHQGFLSLFFHSENPF